METALTITTLSFSLPGAKRAESSQQKCHSNWSQRRMEQSLISSPVRSCVYMELNWSWTGILLVKRVRDESYCSRPSAGPPFSTSDMTMDVSPLWKWGLSLPPEIAIPKPNPGACETHNHMLTNRRGGNQNIQNSREELERDRENEKIRREIWDEKRRKINEGMWWSERYRERVEKGGEIERSYHRYKEK